MKFVMIHVVHFNMMIKATFPYNFETIFVYGVKMRKFKLLGRNNSVNSVDTYSCERDPSTKVSPESHLQILLNFSDRQIG